MPIGDPMHPRMSWILLVFWLSLSCFPGLISSAVVTLKSIEIYTTHEMLKSVKPVVYFRCKGESKTELPDVKKPNEVYNFKGEESWQPLTNLTNSKCKRCGFYEEDSFIKSDDIFDEWEFCPSDFPHGIYTRIKEKEMNATFTCPQCIPLATASETAPDSRNEGKGMHVFLVILIVMVVSTVIILGMVAAYKYWQKRKRQQDQARFLKLFEDGDDIEDELGLDNVI